MTARFGPHPACPLDVTPEQFLNLPAVTAWHRPQSWDRHSSCRRAGVGGISGSHFPWLPSLQDLSPPWLLGCDHSTPSLPSSLGPLLWTPAPGQLCTLGERSLHRLRPDPTPVHSSHSEGAGRQHPPPWPSCPLPPPPARLGHSHLHTGGTPLGLQPSHLPFSPPSSTDLSVTLLARAPTSVRAGPPDPAPPLPPAHLCLSWPPRAAVAPRLL